MNINQQIDAFRAFNRFYTRQIGLLNRTLLESSFSLTQARILFELANREQATASDLMEDLGIDRGYLSRTLHAFEKQGLLQRKKSSEDSRQRFLKLTSKGKKLFSSLNHRSVVQAKDLLKKVPEAEREKLIGSMTVIERILEPNEPASKVILRPHRPGDIGWITHRHGALYSEQYGWDETFEALVAEILARFAKSHNPERERIWIAEQAGESLGSVMVVDAGENVAQLRLLLVEPHARGKKIGQKLVDECIAFSRKKGYSKMRLWTQSCLFEARSLYIKSGFQLVEEKPHHSFGYDLVAQIWEKTL
jgi:DNA-binding MarR family transcriptional regulator/N-acetylglutamate synthase-like GNAT family acetyltransferase